MSDAPERIIANSLTYNVPGDTEYIRLDLHAARVAELEAELQEAALQVVVSYGQAWDAHEARLAAEAALASIKPQCCFCGKKDLSADGGAGRELDDGRWVCSSECWDGMVDLRAALATAREYALREAAVEILAMIGAKP
jgi:hypothetical protein